MSFLKSQRGVVVVKERGWRDTRYCQYVSGGNETFGAVLRNSHLFPSPIISCCADDPVSVTADEEGCLLAPWCRDERRTKLRTREWSVALGEEKFLQSFTVISQKENDGCCAETVIHPTRITAYGMVVQ